jgi:hypothetical protein
MLNVSGFGRRVALLGMLVASAAVLSLIEPRGAEAANLIVDNTTDDPTKNACTAAANDCSLRGAITKANSTEAPDYIGFTDLGTPGNPATILVSSLLPSVNQPLFLNGLDSLGGGIAVQPVSAGAVSTGLFVFADNSSIFGFRLSAFGGNALSIGAATNVVVSASFMVGNGGHGIAISNSNQVTINGVESVNNSGDGINLNSSTSDVTIRGSYVGLRSASLGDFGNGGDGVEADGSGHRIGIGGNPDDRNYISGNVGAGVHIVGGSGTTVKGNFIGTRVDGLFPERNDGGGVLVEAAAQNVRIGGTTGVNPGVACAGDCNLISANGDPNAARGDKDGIHLAGGSGTLIEGNYIGININGNSALPNTGNGVGIDDAQDTTVGGNLPTRRNLISGNNRNGVVIVGPSATGNVVQGNAIGTEKSGTLALGNGGSGVFIAASENIVARNLISGNEGRGIYVSDDTSAQTQSSQPAGVAPVPANDNLIAGNGLGVNVNVTSAIPNGESGVELAGANNTVVGGTSDLARNFISGNGESGVLIREFGSGNQVIGNYIGVGFSDPPEPSIGNAENGVSIDDAPGNIIGGPGGARNVISANNFFGISIRGTQSTGNTIQGNYIGTESSGEAALGNQYFGITVVDSASQTLIGGDADGEGNVISANGSHGIFFDTGAHENTIAGNLIGTDASGESPLGNAGDGINLGNPDVFANVVGGTADGEGNVIAHNGEDGVVVSGPETVSNAILRNSIHSNGSLGIDLGNDGITSNDPGDIDPDANHLQNFPVLTAVIAGAGKTSIQGSLNSHPATQYRLEFFISPQCDPSGNGEGRSYIGFINVTTNASGNATFLAIANTQILSGVHMTVTATDLSTSDTSEFSPCEAVVQGIPVTPSPTPPGQTPTLTPSPTPTSATTVTPTVTRTTTPTPTPTGATETPSATPTGVGGVAEWGDNNCSGAVDPVDGLLALRFDAGLPTNTGACLAIGDDVEVGGETYAWGDVDCSGTVGPVDGLKVLRYDAGLSIQQEENCPQPGQAVQLAGAT